LSKKLTFKLSALFFFQYALNSAIYPIFALYMKNYLGFSGSQAGIVLATSSVTAFVSPLVGAVIADKFISSERLFGICNLTAGGLLLVLAFQKTFVPVIILYFLFSLFYGPSVALANAIVFHHAPGGRERFGGIRLWGTVGWVTVAFGFGLFWLNAGGALRDALILAGFIGLSQGIFALTLLPKGEKRASSRKTLFPLEALKVFARKDVLLLSLTGLMFVTGEKVYYFASGIFLRSQGMAESTVLPFMSIAQIAEVGAMILLGYLLTKWETKKVLLLGLGFSLVKFTLLALGQPMGIVAIGVMSHGPAFTFFMITSFIYLDRHCRREIRSGVHQFYSFLEAGIANFLGNVGAGLLLDNLSGPGGVNYRIFWGIPLISTILLIIIISLFFPNKDPEVVDS